jgi:beta-lactamase class A
MTRYATRQATRAVAALGAVGVIAGCTSVATPALVPAPSRNSVTSALQSSSPPVSATPAPSSTAPGRPTAGQVRARAAATLRGLIRTAPQGGVSVAAVNLDTGRAYAAGESSGVWTASAYKLFVVVALLLNRQAGGELGLSSSELSYCAAAIENSDNRAGYALFLDAGGNPTLQQVANRLRMRHTDADGTDPAFTRTSAADYVKLLRALVDDDSPLSAASRRYVLGLMSQVEADQRWGVGVVADDGTTFYNKNGWVWVDNTNGPGERDNDLWVASSVGIATVQGHKLLLSVFTQHNSSFEDGVARVQALVRPLASLVTGVEVG